MISIATYGTCQEMHMNGPQNTLPTLTLATSPLVFIMEDFTTQIVAEPAIARLTASSISRLAVSAIMVYVPYFM